MGMGTSLLRIFSRSVFRRFFFLLSGIFFLLFHPPTASAASFSISNPSPFLGDSLSVSGCGLTPNYSYYLYDDEAGVYKDYTDTSYQGRTAKLFSTDATAFSTGRYYAHAFAEFDKVLALITYYDEAAATPLFRVGASDIYWSNGGGPVEQVDVNSAGLASWVTWSHAFAKDRGVPDFEWSFKKVGSNTVYIDQIYKLPMWDVTTNGSGCFTKALNAPRAYTRNSDLSFTFKLFDPALGTSETVGQVIPSVNYDNFRSARDMFTFHYIYVRPEHTNGNFGAAFASEIRNDSLNYRYSQWDLGFMGGVFAELGYPDLRNEQATRIGYTIRHSNPVSTRGCYSPGYNNWVDCTMAAWVNIRPAYEATGDSTLRAALVDILDNSMAGYDATYNQFGDTAANPKRFMVDAGGGKPQFFWYMGGLLGNPIYRDYAKTMVNTLIDKLQTSEGWFYQFYYFDTDTTSSVFWDGGQGWALIGLREFKDLIKGDPSEQNLVTKINTSLEKLADNLTSRPVADLRSDRRRSPIISYNLLKLAQDPDFPARSAPLGEFGGKSFLFWLWRR